MKVFRPALLGCVIGVLVFSVYFNSLHAPFVFDDEIGVIKNPTIRALWPLSRVLSSSQSGPTNSRPMVNLSLAVNYKIGGLNPFGYHLANVLMHAIASLALFGVVRRTITRRWSNGRVPMRSYDWSEAQSRPKGSVWDAGAVGFFVAAIWALHPLQTESVTCVIQRTESLMGMFFLLSAYGFVRSVDAQFSPRWQFFCIAMCILGMGCKEVMVMAPPLILLYDLIFVSGDFKAVWHRRSKFHIALFSTWIVLGILVYQGGGSRGGAAGLSTTIAPWLYILTQCKAIVHYLWLALWPSPLVLDYGMSVVKYPSDVWLQGVLLLALLAGSLCALCRRSAYGFMGAWFFAILAPSSSVVPLATQTIAEHRMYLPLAAIIAICVVIVHRFLGRCSYFLCGAVLVVFGCMTVQRNKDYQTPLALWSDTVRKMPNNPRAQYNLGIALLDLKQINDAERCFIAVFRLKDITFHVTPDSITQTINEDLADAKKEREGSGLRVDTELVGSYIGFGRIASVRGQTKRALDFYFAALRLDAQNTVARENLAAVLMKVGRINESEREYLRVVTIDPNDANGWYGLACVYTELNNADKAIASFQKALLLRPDFADAHNNLGSVLQQSGRIAEARAHFEKAIQSNPRFALVYANLATLLAQSGLLSEARIRFAAALDIEPDNYEVRTNYGLACELQGDLVQALEQYRKALDLRPGYSPAALRLNSLNSRLGEGYQTR